MEKIMLPTDLFIRMQDWDLDNDTQLLFLALIINRPVNLTGVYVITRREMRHQLQPRDNEGRRLQDSLEKLKSKHLVYYDDNVIFIPLIPETSKFARHSFRYRMQRHVDRLHSERPSNSALRAFADWCLANNVTRTPEPSQDLAEPTRKSISPVTSDKNDHQHPRLTLAEKYANMSDEERFSSISQRQNEAIPTDKKPLGPGQAPSISLSSSSSSSYYSRRSSGIDVKGGAGEIFAEAGGESDFFASQSSDFGSTDSADNDDEEAA